MRRVTHKPGNLFGRYHPAPYIALAGPLHQTLVYVSHAATQCSTGEAWEEVKHRGYARFRLALAVRIEAAVGFAPMWIE